MLRDSNLFFPQQTGFYRGKVRDIYYFGDKLALLASDRISAFDVILRQCIPFKGQVLNELSSFFLKMAEDQGIKTWFESSPHPYLSVGKRCRVLSIEIVVRGYLTGHAWRVYASGRRELCGVQLAEGLKENDRFESPIITPTTKASEGHDEDISREEILTRGIVEEKLYEQIEATAKRLFQIGTKHAHSQGLILVDTKYEFGLYEGELYVIDEIHTPDSSRYFYADSYQDLHNQGLEQKQLSKEFVRKWLIERGFQGKINDILPDLDEEFIGEVSKRYIELYEKITGLKFNPKEPDLEEINEKIKQWLN
jgi:phosphoribosylaminoimidazole-succinocarboxamide synthase